MDLETENRIAAILIKEAAELRKQAEKEGVDAYLRQPKFRGRPNSRFLTATVLGVQQANRAVEVNEMWRVRQKELELDDRLKVRSRDDSSSDRSNRDSSSSKRSTNKRHIGIETSASVPCSSSKRAIQDFYSSEDEGLKDEDIDEFLHSRVKRGRGAVGSRMDETGPYLPPSPDSLEKQFTCSDIGGHERWERRVLGPEKPSSLKPCASSERESLQDKRKKAEKVGPIKRHSRKHKSKDKSSDKKKNREEKRRKQRK